jgi:hypothetical protein
VVSRVLLKMCPGNWDLIYNQAESVEQIKSFTICLKESSDVSKS